jgi:hypothetical protein
LNNVIGRPEPSAIFEEIQGFEMPFGIATQIIFPVIYLASFSQAIWTISHTNDIDAVKAILDISIVESTHTLPGPMFICCFAEVYPVTLVIHWQLFFCE